MFVVLTMQKAHKEIAKEQRKYSCNTETERERARETTLRICNNMTERTFWSLIIKDHCGLHGRVLPH